MALSSPGIGSNLDVNSIVQQLMAVEAQPLTTLAKKEAAFQAKISAFGSLSGTLGSFQSALNNLSDPAKFQSLTASTSDAEIATASAASTASSGSYNINVTALAQAQTVASAGQVSTTAAIGSGATTTLTFQFGTIGGGTTSTDGIYPIGTTFTQDAEQATGTVTIDSSNNSLQGIRDAINKAGIGVTASIIADGSDTPNRLVLTSSKTGASSSMKITVSGDTALQGLLAYNPADAAGQKLTESSTAADTELTVNGIAITSATKTVTDSIQGVTINVIKEGSTTLSVSRDTATMTSTINAFVKAYNDVNKTLKDLTAYNPETKAAGPLIGDATVRSIQVELRKMLTTPIPELSGSFRTLSDIGIAFQKDGSLAADADKLKKAITDKPAEVAALFSPFGTPSDSLVNFVSSTSKTQAAEYELNITAMATQGSQVGSLDLNVAPTVIAADTTMNVTLDGISATVALTAGSYTASQLAAMLQSAINGTEAFSDAEFSVKATVDDNGFLNIASNRYGSTSGFHMATGAGTNAESLFGSNSTTTAGIDVAGTIGGMEAGGSGQYLTGSIGTTAEGLKLLVSGGTAGARGTIDFSRGYADKLNDLVSSFLGSSGLIAGRTDGLKSSIESIDTSRESIQERLVAIEKRYRAQFTALDTMISSMNQTSMYLQQQLANLPTIESE